MKNLWLRLNSEDNIFSVDTILGDRFLLVKRSGAGASKLVHDMSTLTGNGTWAAAGSSDATNLTADTVTKKLGNASINFDIDVSASGNDYAAIENSTMTAVDLSSMADAGVLFFWVYIPDVTNVTSVLARWGSGSGDYYENSVTTSYNGQSFRNGWNRVGIAWEGSTATGTPVDTAIDFLHLRVVYSVSQADDTDLRIDEVRMETPDELEIPYYSTRFCKSTDNSLQDNFTANDDETLLEDEDDDVLFWYALADALWIKDRFTERQEALRQHEIALDKLRARYMSERKREVVRYY